ncbi:hypothetical protein EVJ58_g18 [Rhodofomes roseus]|uniref:Poly(A) polymerase n=1 Tax=Rhodofomes roseus TaxID=34475 RepID=A0A4Y9Z6D2_9APHY|nr:hypothetical protein EVJ58_g18 [Rhodofomes roseus]
MGVTFATHFVNYCTNVKNVEAKEVTKIESNPEQSKHLETARTTVLGQELDFVNLRSEEYTEDSRIPTSVDALRRDITINALFYNVHTRAVEDHTGKGIKDLQRGMIRTPLDALETFRDDPLRVLRAIRFAARYCFEIDRFLQDAARKPEIREALASKISKERIGIEVDKMLRSRDPVRALSLIYDFKLYSTVFQLPESVATTLSDSPTPPIMGLGAATILMVLLLPSRTGTLIPVHKTLTDLGKITYVRARLYLACALTPYRGITYTNAKGKRQPACDLIIRESLRLGSQNHYLDGVPALYNAWSVVSPAVADLAQGESPDDKLKIGMFLRQQVVHRPAVIYWHTSLLFSLVQDLMAYWDPQTKLLDETAASERIALYNALVTKIENHGLPAVVDDKPLLKGGEIAAALNTQTGPWMRDALTRVVEWQLIHPEGTKAECVEWVKAEHAAGNIDISPLAQPKRPTQPDEVQGAVKKPKLT